MPHPTRSHAVAGIAKTIGIWLAAFLVLVVLVGIAAGLYQTRKVEHSADQAKFRSGTVPEPLPDGFYQGNAFTGLGKNWQGKVFDRAKATGINQFAEGQRFTFTTYPAAGLRDHDRQVLRINYNQPGNPWWLHFVTDEIVQTQPGHYLGKIHIRPLPGLVFTLGYFELSQQ